MKKMKSIWNMPFKITVATCLLFPSLITSYIYTISFLDKSSQPRTGNISPQSSTTQRLPFQNTKKRVDFLGHNPSQNRCKNMLSASSAIQLDKSDESLLKLNGLNLQAFGLEDTALWQTFGNMLIEVGASSVELFEDYPGQCWATFPEEINGEETVHFAMKLSGIENEEIGIQSFAVEAQEMWKDVSNNNLFLPQTCGKVQVLAVHDLESAVDPDLQEIRILPGQAWGNGDHPTTRLCLEFISDHVKDGQTFIDYGCGSSVLSIAAVKLGAKHVFATDVCLDTLANAEQNLQTNGVCEQVELSHPRTIVIGDLQADLVVANILPGVLIRLRHTLALAVKPGGLLCLSGMRPTEVDAVKEAFSNYIDWDDTLMSSGSHPEWGPWVRIAGHPKDGIKLDEAAVIADLSETAVS